MIRFAAHLEMNFGAGHSFHDRWMAARNSGFQGCEFVWRNYELSEAVELRQAAPLEISCLGGTTGIAAGARPVLVLPEDRERLARDVESAVAYARALSCSSLVMVSGNLIQGWSIDKHRQEAVTSLKYVAPILEEAGVTALIEPLNSKIDHNGVYCDTAEEGFRIIHDTGSPNVKLLYDAYHMHIMHGNVVQEIRSNHAMIGYYHLARVPGRNEPIGGEIDYEALLEAVAASGYDGFIGLEYAPSGDYAAAFQRIKHAYPAYISMKEVPHE
ncbi:hydroxypyruvate isomerase family protein [Paenibacillus spongiae]|uniref:TIM barrel protein n=1 Tax=Paenibacillus spongiae TaxID=2909671 RepID=A0ABY5SB69_9BACL|nr:TIM barrel protein [Paenibacillus spongiae]UVI30042.1 TIM barrel protein [Paenibacillus spongiae]